MILRQRSGKPSLGRSELAVNVKGILLKRESYGDTLPYSSAGVRTGRVFLQCASLSNSDILVVGRRHGDVSKKM